MFYCLNFLTFIFNSLAPELLFRVSDIYLFVVLLTILICGISKMSGSKNN